MNVSHLSRLGYPFGGEKGGGALGKEGKMRKILSKKEDLKKKGSTWMALTFLVYYRIHLNLNLEASARQCPDSQS